jgi:hypothetical protein
MELHVSTDPMGFLDSNSKLPKTRWDGMKYGNWDWEREWDTEFTIPAVSVLPCKKSLILIWSVTFPVGSEQW